MHTKCSMVIRTQALFLAACGLLTAGLSCIHADPTTHVRPTSAPTPPLPVDSPKKFTWTDAPTLDAIPQSPVTGKVNGGPFTAVTIEAQEWEGPATRLIIADRPDPEAETATTVELVFSLPRGEPGHMVTPLSENKTDTARRGAMYWFPLSSEEHAAATAELEALKGAAGENLGCVEFVPMRHLFDNIRWACALEITDWTLVGDSSDPQARGEIKGRVAICFPDEAKSYVAGTFEAPYRETSWNDGGEETGGEAPAPEP